MSNQTGAKDFANVLKMWHCGRIVVAVLFILPLAGSFGVQSYNISHFEVAVVASGNVALPCSLDRLEHAPDQFVQWVRSELPEGAKYVHLWRNGVDGKDQLPSYRGRTKLFDTESDKGNVVLQLSKVISDDAGQYKCSWDETNCWSTVYLTVVAVYPPGSTRNDNVLKCEGRLPTSVPEDNPSLFTCTVDPTNDKSVAGSNKELSGDGPKRATNIWFIISMVLIVIVLILIGVIPWILCTKNCGGSRPSNNPLTVPSGQSLLLDPKITP